MRAVGLWQRAACANPVVIERRVWSSRAVLKQTEKELQKCQQEIDEFETKVDGMSSALKKKHEDEKSTNATLKTLQKKMAKLQKKNDEVSIVYV